jgi:hypothetical protein
VRNLTDPAEKLNQKLLDYGTDPFSKDQKQMCSPTPSDLATLYDINLVGNSHPPFPAVKSKPEPPPERTENPN